MDALLAMPDSYTSKLAQHPDFAALAKQLTAAQGNPADMRARSTGEHMDTLNRPTHTHRCTYGPTSGTGIQEGAEHRHTWTCNDAACRAGIMLDCDKHAEQPEHKPTPLESSPDAAAEHDIDARMAEAYAPDTNRCKDCGQLWRYHNPDEHDARVRQDQAHPDDGQDTRDLA